MTELLTLYGRQEPTTDAVSVAHGCGHQKDVALYKDAQCTKPVARYGWYLSNKPTKRQKAVMHNCYRWRLQWV